MSKQGTLIAVANSQEGATPRIVTETEPFPVTSGKQSPGNQSTTLLGWF